MSKALAATNISLSTFVGFIDDSAQAAQSVPLLGFAEAGSGGYNGRDPTLVWSQPP